MLLDSSHTAKSSKQLSLHKQLRLCLVTASSFRSSGLCQLAAGGPARWRPAGFGKGEMQSGQLLRCPAPFTVLWGLPAAPPFRVWGLEVGIPASVSPGGEGAIWGSNPDVVQLCWEQRRLLGMRCN